jgi:ABC-type oligopeptide transport system ATPase subunit/NAD(P)-dependent dehydrogenase (short-subunit alcohol dehydrogenase family)
VAEPLLALSGVTLALPDQTAARPFRRTPLRTILHDIDLDVAAGECVAVVGESGSGKSTLARTVLRLHEPQSGRIVFGGVDITHAGAAALAPVRPRLQMIFQDPMSSLNPRRRIADIVAQPLDVAGRAPDAAQVARLLERVQLPAELAARYPHQLSGGQRQRVGIARAIALEPALIVADEIVSGLDVSTQAHVLLLLRELKRDLGLAMIFVTHDLSVVRVLCDRVVVLRAGRVVESALVATLFARPRNPYTRELLDAIPLPEVDPHWLDAPAQDILAQETGTMSKIDIAGCTALVTGANRGLGRALAQALLDAGARKVYATARDTSSLQTLAAGSGGRLVTRMLDITRDDQIAAAAAACRDVDVLINNAGINRGQGLISAASLDDAKAEVTSNYFGTLAMCRAFAPVLKANGGGAIANVLSILAKVTLPAMGSLCASKAAALRMTEGVRAELAAQGTLVTALMTGAMDTDMARDFQGPKSAPADVAATLLAQMAQGAEEVYHGQMPEWINGALKGDAKALEKELAKYLPA